jgi:hypothetical protein
MSDIRSFRSLLHSTLPPMLALALTALAPATADAQLGRIALGLKASTLGLGGEASIGITRFLVVRTGLNRFGMEREHEFGGISYTLNPRLRSVTTVVDLHPFSGAFRLSGGLIHNRNEGRLDYQVPEGETISLGESQYSWSDVQSLTGKIGFKRSAPYVGLGFDNSLAGRGRVSFNMDLGVMFHGQPRARLVGQSTLSGAAQERFEADVAEEAGEVQEDLDGLPKVIQYYPVVAFGLKFRP